MGSSLGPWLGEQVFHVHHPAAALVLENVPVNREGKVGGCMAHALGYKLERCTTGQQ